MTGFAAARSSMIESQLRPNKVTDERVLGAFAAVPRERFVPEALRANAYVDEDLPLGDGRYLMEPMVAARLIQAVAVARSDAALVIGAATGYEAAILAGLSRNVTAVEENPGLARQARAALIDLALAAATIVEGPLPLGWPARGPYAAILLTGAVAEVPAKILGQLGEGGRLAAVVRSAGGIGRATLTTHSHGVLAHRILFDAMIPLLPGFFPKPAFIF